MTTESPILWNSYVLFGILSGITEDMATIAAIMQAGPRKSSSQR